MLALPSVYFSRAKPYQWPLYSPSFSLILLLLSLPFVSPLLVVFLMYSLSVVFFMCHPQSFHCHFIYLFVYLFYLFFCLFIMLCFSLVLASSPLHLRSLFFFFFNPSSLFLHLIYIEFRPLPNPASFYP